MGRGITPILQMGKQAQRHVMPSWEPAGGGGRSGTLALRISDTSLPS